MISLQSFVAGLVLLVANAYIVNSIVKAVHLNFLKTKGDGPAYRIFPVIA